MLARFVIERWQLTMVLFLLLVLLGLNALFTIPRAVDPHFPIPSVNIIAVLPGADAQDMEETVAKPIEDAVQSLDDIDEIVSTSTDGGTTIRVTFTEWRGAKVEGYFDDVIREISAIRSDLPANLQRLEFRRYRTTEAAVVQVALVSETASWRRMEKYADDLVDKLTRYDDVREVQIFGLPQPEVSIEINAARMSELKVAPSALADAVRQGGLDFPGGAVQSGGRRLNVDAGGVFRDLDKIRELPLRASGGTLLTVGDVADIKWGAAEQIYRTRHNGKRAVFLAATQKDGIDVSRLIKQLDTELDGQRDILPPDIKLEMQMDQSRDVERRLGELSRDFLIAIGLVIITLLPLGFRASGIVMISIPLSLASGLVALQAFGYNLSQLSIAGFIVSLGLLVDDSIVVTENIARHLRMGKTRKQAAIDASLEIRGAVIGSTFVLVFAFAPLLFLPGGAGSYTNSFFLAIMLTVLASLVISLSLIPFFASKMLKRDENPEGNFAFRWVSEKIQRFYRPFLHVALGAPWKTVVIALVLCTSAFALVPSMGFSLFPVADAPYFRVSVETEQGSSLDQTDIVIKDVAEILENEPSVVVRAENIGRGNPQVFYNVGPGAERTNYGEILAVMDEWDKTDSPEMVERLRKKFDTIPGARIKLELFNNGPPIEAPVAIRIAGPKLDELKTLAGQVADILRDTPGARDINNPVATDKIDLDIGLDEQKAALLNIPAGEPRRAIRLALSGERAATFRDEEGDNYPVTVRLPLRDTQPVSALDDVYLATRSGDPIALSQISNPKLTNAPPQIQRYQLERSISVTAQVELGAVSATVTDRAVRKIKQIDFPEGYSFEVGGESEAIGETFGDLGPIVITSLLVIFGILVAEFRRFKETIVVAGVIPLGTFGGLIALFITGNSLSFMAVIGFIALIGIEIKNSILLVDFTTQLRDQGMGLRDAIEKAGEVRFLPVLLTSVTAIGGLLPLAILGGSLYAPVAIIIIGGLISSTLLSRVVTPAMYWLVARRDEERRVAKNGNGGTGDKPAPV
ncbi:efflux RND transporter permease subunit [Parasphingorhabdus halotolerans]|uniref:Efflux RND transporter permease subunit n=1 Tax=Parasphingorhabdus halotolerans TaxID=2725558 RepID=A0A6H2DQX9_9SPHN|nr:efflux RND transporter permease subunit [Parasphingorhabdus halotolerans]QJB70076.1 efflux RND transporter permease subunit [Parasphingorhabdus halotolerans]